MSSEYLTEPVWFDGRRFEDPARLPESCKRNLRRTGILRSRGNDQPATDDAASPDDSPSLTDLISAADAKKFAANDPMITTLDQATAYYEEQGDFTGITGIGKVGSEKIAIELGLVDPPKDPEETSDDENTDEDDSEEDSAE